jgi:hypothetical protein
MKILITLIVLCSSLCFASHPNDALVKQFNLDVGNYLLPAKDKISLENWTNPSIEDYQIIQNYLSHAPRPELAYLNYPDSPSWREKRMRNFKIITETQHPEFHIKFYNDDPSDKENCIVTYISFNELYSERLNVLIDQLTVVGFTGHLIYRMGGWPNTEENSLELFDVPYAFKLFSLLEAKRLGYKNCLWLDPCFFPIKPLDPIFKHIAEHGVFFRTMPHLKNRNYVNEFSTLALGNLTLSEFAELNPINTNAIGLDVTSPRGNEILSKWLEMAKNKLGFLSFFPEMAPWYIIGEELNLLPYADESFIAHSLLKKSPSTILEWKRFKPNP